MMNAEEILQAAVEKNTPGERAAYLDSACGADAALRALVEGLLQAHDDAGSFLEQPLFEPGLTVDEPRRPEKPGTVIGPYKLLEQIGEGGFGVVFMAEQEQPIRRKVALKVLKPGMDTHQVIARFEAERQALALMDHPNIARVLDAGATASGRPYFVMELVKGMPITAFCDESHFRPAQRLELFADVCQAVQHAHQKGVIHRDIKPSNVLVTLHDGVPVVKVIDFGIAKALAQRLTDKTLFTGFAQMIGTPLYMSPEQAALSGLDVDTRSDIYSLGVLLYELLTGTTPFDEKRLRAVGYDEWRRIIREEEPPKPSTRISTLGQAATTMSTQRQSDPRRLSKLFRGELDWIVMKALDKDRNRRYETASALAADVERYLHDEPVQACPPSVGYRLKKLVRRHKGKVAAGLAMLALLLAGAAVSTWQAVRATRAKRAATAAEAHTRDALDALTDDVVETMFTRQSELGETEKAFLRKVLASYETITQEMGETAEARRLRANGFFRVAHLHALLGDQVQAEAGYQQAATLLEQLAADFPDVAEYRQKLGNTHNELGIALAELGRSPQAETSFRHAILLGTRLVGECPEVALHRRDVAVSYGSLATLYQRLEKGAMAEEAYRHAVDLNEKLAEEFPTEPKYQQALARSRSLLGQQLQQLERYAEAEDLLRQALNVQQQHVDKFLNEPTLRKELAGTYQVLGIVLAELKKDTEAETVFRNSLDVLKQLANEFPRVARYREELAYIQNDLGYFLFRLGRYASAEEAYGQALNLKEKLVAEFGTVPKYRSDLARTWNNLGRVLRDQEKYAEAETAYQKALNLRQKLADDYPDAPRCRAELADSQLDIGHLLRRWQRPADALPWYERALAEVQALPQEPGPNVRVRWLLRNAHWDRAQALDALNRRVEAVADWDRAEELSPPGDRPRIQLRRARGQARAGEAAAALATAQALTKEPATRSALCCEAAGVYALASASATEVSQREAYANQALALHRRAQAAGYFKNRANIAALKQDPDLDSLRSREDFQKLVAELEAAAKP
jgi:serine/threonine protein kinase/tetratricopeptide (TPR) repeat protein